MQMMIALLVLAASPDAATSTTSTETPEVKPVKAKKVCRAGASTGTRLPSKICKTQAEWKANAGEDSKKVKNDAG